MGFFGGHIGCGLQGEAPTLNTCFGDIGWEGCDMWDLVDGYVLQYKT